MKYIWIFLLATFAMLVSSCEKSNVKKKNVVVAETMQSTQDKKEQLKKRREIEIQEYVDSLKLDMVLQDALKKANQNIRKDRFVEKYEFMDETNIVKVEINLDYHFVKTTPHLIIRRNTPEAIYIDIYSKGEDKFEKVVSHEQWAITYVNDTIKDVNGDGINDFIVNWYGSSGCCLKAFSDVYILRQDKKTFSDFFEFINPTFSPKERIVRGVCYGQPGDTEMYKYKWNGEKVDTLEYVFYQRNEKGVKTGKVVVSTDESGGDNYRIIKIINSVPTEYRKIQGYDWFIGKGYE